MKLFTEVPAPELPVKLSLGDRIMVLGSCFADNVGSKLSEAGFSVCTNPFGTLYNPESIALAVKRLSEGNPFTESDCVAMGAGTGLVCSFSHHSSFARSTAGEFLENANAALKEASGFWKSCNRVVITLGTAFVWRRNDTGETVCNCLKRPGGEFTRYMLQSGEVTSALENIVRTGSGKEFIFTVSPIRHLGQGAHLNTLSKSSLQLGLDALISSADTSRICYFPAYEIFLDELRDYRFCADDLCHPSAQAGTFIWEKFKTSALVPSETGAVEANEKESRHSRHIPMAKKFTLGALAAILLMLPQAASAQKFDYNVNFQYVFDNSEFDSSHDAFDKSGTLNMVRLNPYVGIKFDTDSSKVHRIRAGVQLEKFMGVQHNDDIFNTILAYYSFDGNWDKGDFGAAAGIFPRSVSEGAYTPFVYDHTWHFYNNYIQGMFFKWRSERLYAELGCDWMGMYGDEKHPDRRERFQIMSAGDWRFAGRVHLGWAASFYHFACCPLYDNVVDNHLVNPFIKWQPDTWFQELSVSVGGVFTYQRDRKIDKKPKTPMGLMSEQHLRKWNVGIRNTFFWGDDLMPYFDSSYGGSPAYGRELYFGDQCFHTGLQSPSAVDLLEVYYEPQIKEWLRVRVALRFHMGTPSDNIPVLRGWAQHASLIFDLDKLVKP